MSFVTCYKEDSRIFFTSGVAFEDNIKIKMTSTFDLEVLGITKEEHGTKISLLAKGIVKIDNQIVSNSVDYKLLELIISSDLEVEEVNEISVGSNINRGFVKNWSNNHYYTNSSLKNENSINIIHSPEIEILKYFHDIATGFDYFMTFGYGGFGTSNSNGISLNNDGYHFLAIDSLSNIIQLDFPEEGIDSSEFVISSSDDGGVFVLCKMSSDLLINNILIENPISSNYPLLLKYTENDLDSYYRFDSDYISNIKDVFIANGIVNIGLELEGSSSSISIGREVFNKHFANHQAICSYIFEQDMMSFQEELQGRGELDLKGEKEVYLYPNPTNSSFSIVGDIEIENILIYNIIGSLIHEQKSSNKEISISDLKAGVYSVIIRTEKEEFLEKLVVE